MKKAFCKMCVTVCGRFFLNEGGVAGYVNRMKVKYAAKWGVQIAGMIFQTRSNIAYGRKEVSHLKIWYLFFRYSQNFILINTSTFLLFFHYALLLCPTFFHPLHFFSVHNSYPSSTSSTLPSHFLSLLVFPLKSAFFPLFPLLFC